MRLLNLATIAQGLILPALSSATLAVSPRSSSQSYGTSQITFYYSSRKCTGSSSNSTIKGPPVVKGQVVYGKCLVSKTFQSVELSKTDPDVAKHCNLIWYDNESCTGSGYGFASAHAGVCHDAIIPEIGSPPSKAALLQCQTSSRT